MRAAASTSRISPWYLNHSWLQALPLRRCTTADRHMQLLLWPPPPSQSS